MTPEIKFKYMWQANDLKGLSKLMLNQVGRDDKGGRTLTEDQLELVTEELLKASKSIMELIGEKS